MNKNLLKNKGGFTLTEVLVGVLVLTVAIVATSNFLVSMIRSNVANTNSLKAYYYTQEGIEAFRNMRDTHFMHNIDFCGGGGVNAGFWGIPVGFSEGCTGDGADDGAFYAVELVARPQSGDVNKNMISQSAPWILTETSEKGAVVKFQKGGMETKETIFSRVCKVSPFEYENSGGIEIGSGKIIKVTCTTEWEERGGTRSVSLSVLLTDWKNE